ncbi:MAG: hypothetical protein WA440_00815 [Ignavibacteriaceae bacterium]
MSAQAKTRAQKAGKFLGIALFAFLMFFNIKFAVSDDTSGDIDLFGLKVSVFTNSTYASSSSYCYKWYPPPVYCYWPPVHNCLCDVIVNP